MEPESVYREGRSASWVSTPATSSPGSATGPCGIPGSPQLRNEVLAHVDGEILEIGFGTGLNLEHYPEHVRHLTAVDPGAGMACIARRRIERSHIDVDLRVQTAEELPFEDGCFDCVVSTWTLCSIRDGRRAIAEILGCSSREDDSLLGARAERRTQCSAMATTPDTRSRSDWPMAAAWTWTSMLWSGQGRSGRSRWSDS